MTRRGKLAPALLPDPLAKCDGCGMLVPVSQLDAKPGPGDWTPDQIAQAGDMGQPFNRTECRDCYGPGWNPL